MQLLLVTADPGSRPALGLQLQAAAQARQLIFILRQLQDEAPASCGRCCGPPASFSGLHYRRSTLGPSAEEGGSYRRVGLLLPCPPAHARARRSLWVRSQIETGSSTVCPPPTLSSCARSEPATGWRAPTSPGSLIKTITALVARGTGPALAPPGGHAAAPQLWNAPESKHLEFYIQAANIFKRS